jgi:hypothetical protein
MKKLHPLKLGLLNEYCLTCQGITPHKLILLELGDDKVTVRTSCIHCSAIVTNCGTFEGMEWMLNCILNALLKGKNND